MNKNKNTSCLGEVKITKEWRDGRKESQTIENTVLETGRAALASSLANNYGNTYDFYINQMQFGGGGTDDDGNPLYVNAGANGLFGATILSKPVSATIDSTFQYQVIFTSVITYEEANGETINEMALQMNNGYLYSMTTFGNITKNSNMQITWTWRISFI